MSQQPKVPQDVTDTMEFVLSEHLRIELGLLTATLNAGSLFRNSQPKTSPTPGGCYEASWGWVHVKPDCHCQR